MRIVATIALLVLQTFPVLAAQKFVVHGSALSRVSECRGVFWRAGAVLHNRNAAPATVRLIGGSAGVFTSPVEVEIPASAAIVAKPGTLAGNASDQLLWVTRLDVPEGVEIEARLDLYDADLCSLRPPTSIADAKIVMPVFDELTPANELQTHLGADLGASNVRLNVAVYNAGETNANVILRARRPLCAQSIATEQTAIVPANTITQIALPSLTPCSSGDEQNPAWSTEVTVESDQPAFSFVSVISTESSPRIFATVVR